VIVGAGPVGLAAAVFLARQGVFPRVIDSAAGISPQSRALAVNPRTLDILESCGVAEEMLGIGRRMVAVQVSAGGKKVGEMSISSLQHRYPFMLALSQGVTTRLLEAKLNQLGGRVEWNHSLTHCRNVPGGVEAEVKSGPDGAIDTVRCPWLLAADGARSTVRESLGIEFPGSSFENPWYLADVPLCTSLSQDHAHVFFQKGGGFLFVIRVINEPENGSPNEALWRVIGNMPDPLERLEGASPCGAVVWQSSFHISHRINRQLQQGAVYFAGDAAHLHSPIGARGMNLGIEDAWVFSELFKAGRLADYHAERYPVDHQVVKRVEMVSRLAQIFPQSFQLVFFIFKGHNNNSKYQITNYK